MIFLSYARDDHDPAEQLESRLRSAGFPIAKDEPRPESNPFWRTEVLRSLRAARVLVAMWSRNARASPWVDQEIRAFDGVRVWFSIDDADLPCPPGEQNLAVRDWAALDSTLASLVGTHRSAAGRDVGPAEPWRRREILREGQASLDRFRRQIRPLVTLREADEHVFVTEPYGQLFRRVTDDVLIGSGPVTTSQYARFIAEAGLTAHPAIDLSLERCDLPVVSLSWFEAVAFAEWHGGSLPTEAEWQQAAETTAKLEYATATGDVTPDLAWFGGQFAIGDPRPSSAYPPNPAGFYGMCGNTWDWCSSTWLGHQVVRGGSWMDSPAFCTVTARYRNSPVDRDCTVGFRMQLRARKVAGGRYEVLASSTAGPLG